MKGILHERDIFRYNELEYRILQVREWDIIVVQLHTEKTLLCQLDRKEIEELLDTDIISLEKQRKNKRYLEKESMSEATLAIYEQYEITANHVQAYANSPEWLLDKKQKSEFLQNLSITLGCSLETARRRLRIYLQNGMALQGIDIRYDYCGGRGKARIYQFDRKPGRKGVSQVVRDEKTIQIFDSVKKRYIARKGRTNISLLYVEMIQDYYSDCMVVNGEKTYIPYPIVKRPSKRQLYYHLKKDIDDAAKYCIRNGQRNAWNNIRALSSDTIHPLEIKGVGCCYEMDEMETDYELVQSYDRNQTIGRAVMYLAIDIFSKIIVGYSIGIDNNSWAGAEMVLLNMVEDKVKYCAEKGIAISHEDWPVSHVLPKEITVDNGSEYLSKQFEAYALENGIHISFAPAGMGSMKGNIERKFREFNTKTNGLLPGQIVKGAYRQPYIKQARLTIEEFEKIVIRFILNYNKNPMDSYRDTKEIYQSGIMQSPNNIWQYSYEHTNVLKKITDMDRYRLSLLCSGTATITREGIVFQKLIYTCEDLEWLSYEMSISGVGKRKSLSVKYDKRCMDRIYFLNDNNEYVLATLNERKTINEKYQHLSYIDILAIQKKKQEQIQANEEVRVCNNVQLLGEMKQIVKEAKEAHEGINTGKYKRENRALEKERLHQERNVISEIGKEKEIMKLSEKKPELSGEEPKIPKGKEEQQLTTEELVWRERLRKYNLDY